MMIVKIKRFLLFLGIAATVNYFFADIITAYFYPGYSYIDLSVSELSAIGSPTANLWKILTILYSPMVILYGIGVVLSAKEKISLRMSGSLIFLFGLSGYSWLLFPMNMRGNIGSASDTGHLALAALTVLILTLFISFGAFALDKKFRYYSFLTILIMLFFGFLTSRMIPNVEANTPTPLMGIYERISVFSPMLWMSVLAARLMRQK